MRKDETVMVNAIDTASDDAAGINICQRLLRRGITTCAANQVGSTISSLDNGNQ